MYLGIEIGGTKLQLGVGNAPGRLQDLVRVAVVRQNGRRGILTQIAALAPPLLHRYPVKAIGVGFGGPVDRVQGRVLRSHQIAGWRGFALRKWCEQQLGRPTIIENDANAAALAEAVQGAGRGKRTVLYVTVGTGIGGGFVIDGQIYQGQFGAAEIGHTRLPGNDRGGSILGTSRQQLVRWPTVESLASGLALERGTSPMMAARYLGVALANAITLLNPEIVVVGGGVSQAGAKFFGPLGETVRALVFAPYRKNYRIVPAALGETVVVVGAVLVASGNGSKSKSKSKSGRQ